MLQIKMILSSLEDMIRFAKSVKEWLKADPENVIVVHCKGGKGKKYITKIYILQLNSLPIYQEGQVQ